MVRDNGITDFKNDPIVNYRVGNSLLYLGFLEMAVVHWCYGTGNFMRNLIDDMELKIPKFMQVCIAHFSMS